MREVSHLDRVNEHDLPYRHGTHGPKYLFRGPKHEWGIIVLRPGDSLSAHRHAQVEETFFFEAGTPCIIVNGAEHRVRPGDVFRLEPMESHDIVNDSDTDCRIIFIKCPYLPDDKQAV
jgi:mannose-6-phosphate isomerase-like protein (cupin superfamily)